MRQPPGRLRSALLGAVVVGTVAAVTVSALGTAGSRRPAHRAAVAVHDRQVAAAQASRSRPLIPVASLKRLLVPDLLVSSREPLTTAQAAALRQVRGVAASTVLGTGTLRVGGVRVHTLGVDPSQFRAFTPRATASSNALWAAVARGDLAPAYAAKLSLGQTVPVTGPVRSQGRIGALADYGLPGADLVVNREVGSALGLHNNAALIAAPDRGLWGLKRDVRAVLGDAVEITELRPVPITYRRPATYRELYLLSAQYCPGLSWKVLAAIGQIESGHGRNVGPSSAGALGPMQFMPATWASAGVDGDGDGRADIMSAFDAVPAAALYLCRNGAGRGGQSLYNAVFSYNHADWYVREVLDLAARYA